VEAGGRNRIGSALHPDLSGEERTTLLAAGVAHFNRQEFFAAHEPWEAIWRSTLPEPRDVFQGLVQIAAGLHHFERFARRPSALRLLGRGRRRLTPFAPAACGLDLASLLAALEPWEEWLAKGEGAPPPGRGWGGWGKRTKDIKDCKDLKDRKTRDKKTPGQTPLLLGRG